MADKPRLVFNGVGAVALHGIGKDACREGLLKARSGIRRITRSDARKFPWQIVGEVDDFQPASSIDPGEVKRLSWVSQSTLVGARTALDDSALQVGLGGMDSALVLGKPAPSGE